MKKQYYIQFGTRGGKSSTLVASSRKEADTIGRAVGEVWLDRPLYPEFCRLSAHTPRWAREEPSGRYVEVRTFA